MKAWIARPSSQRIVLILAIAAAAAIGFTQVRPALQSASRQSAAAAKSDAAAAVLQANLRLLQSKTRSPQAKDLAQAIRTALPETVTWDEEFGRVSDLASYAGASIDNFQHGEPAQASGYQKVPMTLTVSCSYESCVRFLGGLRGLVRFQGRRLDARGTLWYVDQVSVSAAETGKMTLNLSAGIYLAGTPGQKAPA